MTDNKEECIDAKTGKLQEMLRKGNKLYAEGFSFFFYL